FFSPHLSGIYSGAAVAGRMALFASGALALVAFPRFTAAHVTSAERRRVLVQALLMVAAVGVLASLVLVAVPHIVVDVLLGAKYNDSAGLLRILGVEGASLSVLTLIVYFQIARRSRLALVAWPASGLIALAAWVLDPNANQLAWITTGVVLTMTGVSLLVALVTGLTPRAARQPRHVTLPSLGNPAEVDLTLVVPFFNPGERLRPHLDEIVRVLDQTAVSYELIPVADGCTDGSHEQLQGLPADKVRPVVYTDNRGKGHALHIGLADGRGRYLGFVDADGDLPAELLRSFVGVAFAAEPDLAIGSKRHPGSRVVYPENRRMYSWVYQRFVHLLFGLSVRDTQTGLKIVRRDVLAAALPRMLEKRYAFDLELLVVARRLGYTNVIELPVIIKERISTTISLRQVRRILQDTLAIFYRLRILRWYDVEPDNDIVSVELESPAREPSVVSGLA
ncbi:MAG: hypothetical protein QOJ03_218, partial [Frankiaceae bacterium]|nr:hypothetical protein [Frankiaceae bacterium]